MRGGQEVRSMLAFLLVVLAIIPGICANELAYRRELREGLSPEMERLFLNGGIEECKTYLDCPLPKPYCKKDFPKVIGLCVECLTNSNCPQGLACSNVSYQCVPGPRVVFTMELSGYTVATFGPAQQSRFCANLLSLSPPGSVCKITSIVEGSVIVTGAITTPTETDTVNLTNTLTSNSTAVTNTIVSGLNTTVTVLDVTPEPSPAPTPTPPTPNPPQNVVATAGTGCSPTIGLRWDTPAAGGATVLFFSVRCETGTSISTTKTSDASTLSTVVSNVTAGAAYTCSVITVTAEGSASASAPGKTTYNYPTTCDGAPQVVFTMQLDGYSKSTFGQTQQTQLCNNVLVLAPATSVCKITSVVQGSAIPTGIVRTQTASQATALATTLTSGTSAVKNTLATGLSGGVSVLSAAAQASPPPTPTSPKPPTAVVAAAGTGCSPTIDVRWQAPAAGGATVIFYAVECVAGTNVATSKTSDANTLSLVMAPVVVGAAYTCTVSAITAQGSASASALGTATYNYPSSCIPPVPTNVATAFVSYEKRNQRTVTWSKPTGFAYSITGYKVRCTSSAIDERNTTVTGESTTTAIIGSGTGVDAELTDGATYTCVVYTLSNNLMSDASAPSASFVSGSLPPTGTFTVNTLANQAGNFQWGLNEIKGGGTASITSSPSPITAAVKLTTTCDVNDKAQAAMGFANGMFDGMSFSDFVNGLTEISYKVYKVNNKDSSGCGNNWDVDAAPLLNIGLKDYASGEFSTLVFEPYLNQEAGGSSPLTTDTWLDIITSKTTGSDPLENGGTGWAATKYAVTPPTDWTNFRGSLPAVVAAMEGNNPGFTSKAVIEYIALSIGTYNEGVEGYANAWVIKSGSYSWTFNFELP